MREKYADSLGKFDSAMTAYLWENVLMDSGQDEEYGNSDMGSTVRIGRWLMWCQSSGAVYSYKYSTEDEAKAAFSEGENEYYTCTECGRDIRDEDALACDACEYTDWY